MKRKENPEQPRLFAAITVFVMLLSVASMLTVGLASGFQSSRPARPAAQSLSHPVRSTQPSHLGALRARIAQWVAYIARSG